MNDLTELLAQIDADDRAFYPVMLARDSIQDALDILKREW